MPNLQAYEYGRGTPSSAAVSTSDSVVLAANPLRRSAVLSNNGNANIFLAVETPAVANQGILLVANGGSYEINAKNLTRGAIHGVTAIGAGSLSIHEGQ